MIGGTSHSRKWNFWVSDMPTTFSLWRESKALSVTGNSQMWTVI
jgi:hypothetical protein